MTTAIRTGLTRITVSAPRRRIDLVLPDHVPVAELLPTILDYAGDGAADEAEKHGGFDLRRGDGKRINPAQSMAMQQIRDGEILELAPRHADWPEGEYDDVVEAIAAGAKVLGKPWDGNHTRIAGLSIAAAASTLLLLGLFYAGPPWTMIGAGAAGIGLLLLVIGIGVSRSMADSVAGATLGGLSLPYAAFGGYTILGGPYEMSTFDAQNLLVASALVTVFGIIGFYGVGESLRVFTAGTVVGLLGMIAAVLAFTDLSPAGVGAATISITVALLPSIPVLSMRMAKLPMPELPQSAKDLVKDKPSPPKDEIFAKVLRADELLTGLLLGVSIVTAFCLYFVYTTGVPAAAQILLGVVGGAFLLRARLFPAVRQRVPLMVTGVLGFGMLALYLVTLFGPGWALLGFAAVLLPAVIIAAASGLVYSRKTPSPYIGRIADLLDVLCIVAVVPVACTTMGLFTLFRELV